MNKIGQMSCNPAVGGIAKGQIVREIDALGTNGNSYRSFGYSISDAQSFKRSAMWSPRSQSDRHQFILQWIKILTNTPNFLYGKIL
jgi:tRNA uridine 5-carboxymethylaminomethyl modification enzyme